MKITKFVRSLFGLSAVAILLLASCMGAVDFDPDKALATVKVTGELGFYDANNAVFWVINKTQTVTVNNLSIGVRGETVETYPREYVDIPEPGHSLATYHKPAKDRYEPTPYFYEITMDVNDPRTGNDVTLPVFVKQFPLPGKDYAVFLVRMKDGTLALVDQEDLKPSQLDPNDTSNPPEPETAKSSLYPLIVRNRTRSAIIDSIVFGETLTHASHTLGGDQYGYYLKADAYVTYINYTIIGGLAKGRTPDHRVEIIRDTSENSQSIHLLYLDFYHAVNGEYVVTQNWSADGPEGPNDLDKEKNYHGNFDIASVEVINETSKYIIYAIGARREGDKVRTYRSPEYVVDYATFDPVGVIAAHNTKLAGFNNKPLDMPGFNMPYNASYLINVYLRDRIEDGPPRYIVIPYDGWLLLPGKTAEKPIIVTDLDVEKYYSQQDSVDVTVLEDDKGFDVKPKPDGTGNKNPTTEIEITFDVPGDDIIDVRLEKRRPKLVNGKWEGDGFNGRGRGRILGRADGKGPGDWTPILVNGKWVIRLNVEILITGVITVVVDRGETDENENPIHRSKECFAVGRKTPKKGGGHHTVPDEFYPDYDDPETDPDIEEPETDTTTSGTDIIPSCSNGQIGIPITSVNIKGTNTYNMKGPEWQSFQIEILPTNASHKNLLWSKGVLVWPESVDFRWTPPTGSGNIGTLEVKMSAQYREKMNQLPREAQKLDMMVWADNCTEGSVGKSTAPQNYSREEGVLFVTGRTKSLAGFPTPLYTNPPSLEEWDASFKNAIDKSSNHGFNGIPYTQPKVKIGIKQ